LFQRRKVDRFGQVIIRAVLHSRVIIVRIAIGREEKHFQVCIARLDPLEQFETAHPRHIDVRQNQSNRPGFLALEGGQSSLA
jgi:hypothetical protein